jgi:hypothetical protein
MGVTEERACVCCVFVCVLLHLQAQQTNERILLSCSHDGMIKAWK